MFTPLSQASWISSPLSGGADSSTPAPYFRKTFQAARPLAGARLHITALGLYEAEINGQRVGDHVFAPGWTDYHTRVAVQTYDVTSLLRSGENVLGAILGDGWYCGHVAWKGRRVYGDKPALLAALEISYQDGSSEVIVSDTTWKTSTGPIAQSDFLMGEDYDARLEQEGWSQPGFDDSIWQPSLTTTPDPLPELSETLGVPVKRIEEIQPKVLQEGPVWLQRHRIYDFGQNFSGRIRIRVKAARGTVLRFRFAEILNTNGSLYTENLRSARCTDYYTCKGGGQETWESRFTFHGFRYAEAEVSKLREGDYLEVTGVVLHSDTPPTGTFRCSSELLNQLQHNIVWGQKSNFLEVPTDCPQRDERLGWTGDAQVFIRTACFNMDVRSFFHKWMRDNRDSQTSRGGIPSTVPDKDFIPGKEDGGPAWSDATIICPWTIYLCYGDRQILEDHYACMQRYLDFLVHHNSKDLIRCHPDDTGWHCYGDWLALDGGGKAGGITPSDLIGTAFLAYDAELMSRIAGVLGREQDAEKYCSLHRDTVAAFQKRYVTGDGHIASGTQTACVLALHFNLVPEELRASAAAQLVRDIRQRDFHIATGFVGTPYILDVLESTGHLDVAYQLLEQESFPSWLFPIKNGATTIWERWDGWTPEKGPQDKSMNSYNHYAYGAVGAWMYKTVAGLELDPEDPGYRHIIFRPRPGGSLTWAEASLQTPHGRASIHWEKSGGALKVEMRVPDGCRATLLPPGNSTGSQSFGPGCHPWVL
jgi:alpha-L-rhamnosidase